MALQPSNQKFDLFFFVFFLQIIASLGILVVLAFAARSEASPNPDPEPEALADPDPLFGLWKYKKARYYDRYNYHQRNYYTPRRYYVPRMYRPRYRRPYIKKRIYFPVKKIFWWF